MASSERSPLQGLSISSAPPESQRVMPLRCRVTPSASAAIQTEKVEYRQGDTVLEGLLVHDDAVTTKRPGILVVHQWKGLSDHEIHRAEMLAKLGYGWELVLSKK